MSHDPSKVAPEDCPEPFWHETHRYCPQCSWPERSKIEPPTITNENDQVTMRLSFGPTLVIQATPDNTGFEVAIFKGDIEGTPLAGISMSFDSQIKPKLHKLGVDLDG